MLKVFVEPLGDLYTVLICDVHHVPPVLLPEPAPDVASPGTLAKGSLPNPLEVGGVWRSNFLIEAGDAVVDGINHALVVDIVGVREDPIILMPVESRDMEQPADSKSIICSFFLVVVQHGGPNLPDSLHEQLLGLVGHVHGVRLGGRGSSEVID